MVKYPVICTITPGVGETTCSTDTSSPGSVITLGSCARVFLPLYEFLIALAYKKAEHIGILHFSAFWS